MNTRQPKCLIYAKTQYPELEPVDGLRMLAKLYTSREIAELTGQAWSSVATRCTRLGIRCLKQSKSVTGKNIMTALAKNKNGIMQKFANYIANHHPSMSTMDALKMLLANHTASELGKMIGAHRTSVVSFCEIRKLDYIKRGVKK